MRPPGLPVLWKLENGGHDASVFAVFTYRSKINTWYGKGKMLCYCITVSSAIVIKVAIKLGKAGLQNDFPLIPKYVFLRVGFGCCCC